VSRESVGPEQAANPRRFQQPGQGRALFERHVARNFTRLGMNEERLASPAELKQAGQDSSLHRRGKAVTLEYDVIRGASLQQLGVIRCNSARNCAFGAGASTGTRVT